MDEDRSQQPSGQAADRGTEDVEDLRREIDRLRSELKTCGARFSEALANAQDILYCYDAKNDCYEYMSHAAALVSGYEIGELRVPGRIPDPLRTIHPDDQDRLRTILAEAQRSGQTMYQTPEVEYRRRKKTGGYLWFRDRATVFLDAQGQIERICGAATNITERIDAETALVLSEQMQKALFESNVDPVLISDLNDLTVAVNPAFEAFFGYSSEELIGRSFPGHQEFDPGSFEAWLESCQEGAGLTGIETRRRAKDGTLYDVSLTISPIRDAQGTLTYLAIAYRDITKQKRATAELRQYREHLERLAQARTAELTRVNRHLEQEIAHREEVHNMLNIQRDLGIALSTCENLNEAAHHILAAAFHVEGFDCGAVFLYNPQREGYSLAAFEGYSRVPGSRASFFSVNSERGTRVASAAASIGTDQPSLVLDDEQRQHEGLKSLAIITIPHGNRVIAVLELASHSWETIPDWTRTALELIAGQIGKAIAHIQALEALQVSEFKYRSLADFIPLTVFEIALSGRFTHVNQHGLDVFGYTQEDIRNGLNITDVIVPEEGQKASLNLQKKIAGESTAAHEYLGVTKGGRKIPIFIHTAIVEYNKNPVCVRGVALDISDRKSAEEQLRQSEQRFRNAFDNAPIGIALIDLAGRFLQVNPRFCDMLGRSHETLIGAHFRNLVRPEDLQETDRIIRDFMEDRTRFFEVQMQLTHQQGHPIWVALSVTVQTNESGDPVKVIAHAMDVTERKQARAEKRQLEAQLSQSQKLEAIGRLAGGVAHDFNNLLTGMIGHAEIAKRGQLPPDRLTRELDGILHLAERGSNLIKQLLAFSRKQVIAPRVIDLNQLLNALRRMMRRIIGEDIALEFEPGEHLARVKIDPGQVEQLLINLSINARDAMPHGGRLRIQTENTSLDEQDIRAFPDAKPGDYVQLTVSDTGAGMSDEIRAQIFEPFFTTKPEGHGTGLGCATVFGIVKQNGGAIEVSSHLGQGTEFRIFLPATQEAFDSTNPNDLARLDQDPSPSGSETILVVEDEDQVRKMVVRVLEQYGYRVMEAKSGKQALELCRKIQEPVDLVLTDVVMPEMNGPELHQQLQKIWPKLKTLYMSGYAKNYLLDHTDLGPGVGYIAKPFRAETLAANVRAMLQRKS